MAYSVYSTLSTFVDYAVYKDVGQNGATHNVSHFIRIAGRAHITDKAFVTPRGAVTKVTDDEADQLMSNPVFQQHLKNGFVALERRGTNEDTVYDDMSARDDTAPLEAADMPADAAEPAERLESEKQRQEAVEEPESATVAPAKVKRSRSK